MTQTTDPFAVTVNGTGRRTVVLGNGFGTTQGVWARLLPWLEERFRVVRFDWPVEPQHYDHIRYDSLEAYAGDLLRIIARAAAEPCIFIGHSMSGMIGMLAARQRPAAFSCMVMINASPRYMDDADYRGGFSEAEATGLLTAMSDNYLGWVREFAPQVVGPLAQRADIDQFAGCLLAMRPDIAFSMALTVFRSDLRDQLDGFRVPTVIVQSRNDPAVPVEVAETLHRAWPHSTLHVIDASGHLPHLTHAPLIRDVLAQVLPRD